MRNNSKLLLALLGGAAAGAAVGMLFAPSSGKGSRKKISSLTNDISNKIIKEAEKLLNLQQEEIRRAGNHASTGSARAGAHKESRQN
jgi:gas vesicle protein